MAGKKKTKSKKKGQQKTQSNDQDQSGAAANGAQSNGPAHHVHASVKGEDLMYISPSRVRFQHSKIRPVFSGCGRSVTETLEEMRQGKLEPGDLPPIQVLIGPDENDGLGPWYFSLNNRRLWVLKQCHKEGLLDNERYNNKIPVRVRMPKSGAEAERYSVDNCALEAKFMREKKSGGGGGKSKKGKGKQQGNNKNQKGGNDEAESASVVDIGADASNEKLNNNVIGSGEKDEDDIVKGIEMNNETTGKEESSDSESESDDDIAYQNPFSALL